MAGGNNKCDVTSATFGLEKVIRTSIVNSSIEYNVPLDKDLSTSSMLIAKTTEGAKKKLVRTKELLSQLHDHKLVVLDELNRPPGRKRHLFTLHLDFNYVTYNISLVQPTLGVQSATVAQTGGYLLRCLLEREFCVDCTDKLESIEETTQTKSALLSLTKHSGINPSLKCLLP